MSEEAAAVRRAEGRRIWKERAIGALISLVTGLILLGSAPFWWHPFLRLVGREPRIAQISSTCGAYTIFAQGRWDPLGAALRAGPDGGAEKLGGFSANEPVVVDGWVHGVTMYPNNPEPFNNDVWFHLANGQGWVSFGGVRAQPVDRDPTDRDRNGGVPAPTPAGCASQVA